MAQAEYLRTSFESPEPDYLEGELLERAVPNLFHSSVQINLSDAFQPWAERCRCFRAVELRLRVAPDRFRVADFAVFSSRPTQAIPEQAPLAVVEVVSPDDRHEDLLEKLDDYEAYGVEFIFVADPPKRKLSRYRHGDLLTVASLQLPEHDITIPLTAIFA
jgi:Uma2 family endonuclease